MSVIDKNMFEYLKNWSTFSDDKRPRNQRIMYVNSHDRSLTNATIRKLMYEIDNIDYPYPSEEYVLLYSAENFYHNMREYYSGVAESYLRKHREDSSLEDIIYSIPPTCGWITLIVEDIEALSGDTVKMEELMKTFVSFGSRFPDIILIGNGDYKDVFANCEYALSEMNKGINAKADERKLMIGCYDQDKEPVREEVVFESLDKQRDVLEYYWVEVYSQLEKKYFDYGDFKALFRDTLDYLIPRVSLEHVYREDIKLIELIGEMSDEKNEGIEGCKLWEFDAAQQFSKGLHGVICGPQDYNADFSGGEVIIWVVINEFSKDLGYAYVSSATHTSRRFSVDNVCCKMDELSKTILKETYGGDEDAIVPELRDLEADDEE